MEMESGNREPPELDKPVFVACDDQPLMGLSPGVAALAGNYPINSGPPFVHPTAGPLYGAVWASIRAHMERMERHQQRLIERSNIRQEQMLEDVLKAAQKAAKPYGGQMKAKRAAEYLDISLTKFYGLVRSGEIPPGYEQDGNVFWDREVLDSVIQRWKGCASNDDPGPGIHALRKGHAR